MRIPFLLKTYPATFGLCIIQLFIFFLIQSHPTVQKTIIDYGVASQNGFWMEKYGV